MNTTVKVMENLNREIFQKLAGILQAENPYVRKFSTLRDWAVSDEAMDSTTLVVHADLMQTG